VLYGVLFSGTQLSQIEVAAYANVGGTPELVDDYLFRTDFVTGISTGISGAQQLSARSSCRGSATGGGGSGTTTFNPLSLTLPSDELAQLPCHSRRQTERNRSSAS
jgi:hypothetical protein